MPMDFLAGDNQNEQPEQSSGRDFLAEPPPESYWESVKSAPGRIVSDLGNAARNGFNAIPGYFEKAKTEIPAFLNPVGQMQRHPFHAAGQELAGINEAINSLAQFPLNVSKYGSERLNLLPQGLTNAIQRITPEDTTQSINQLFGEPQYAGEAALRGGFRNAPSLYGVSKFADAVNPSSLFTTKNSIKKNILNTHDALENRATDAFSKVSDEVNNRGINRIPFNSNVININGITSPTTFFDSLVDYFPKTKQASSLINSARTGDYNSLRKLQTDLYQNAKKNLGSSLEADRMKGAEMMEKRNDINQTISNHLRNTGNDDLDDILSQARRDWSTLQKTYYNENMNNALVKMVDKQFRKIPNNLVDILQEQSIPMQNLRDFHPGLENKLSGYNMGQKVLGKSLKYGIPAVAAYLGYEYGKPKG